jgi:signal transduction histidine kinase
MIVEFTYYPINYYGKTAMQAQVNDITENIRLQKELDLQKLQLIEAVLDAQENERRIIGRELHDNVNQILAALKLNLDLAGENTGHTQMFIANCKQTVSTAMDEVRKLSKELFVPGHLKELGLLLAVEDLIKENLLPKQIQWEFNTDISDDYSLAEEQKLAVYRIIQEQLANIIKYAEASFVTITIQVEGEQISLEIKDNGKGFDASTQKQGIGMTNIISRAELFNGHVKIHSAAGVGYTIKVVLNSRKPASPQTMQILADSIFC